MFFLFIPKQHKPLRMYPACEILNNEYVDGY